MYSYGEIIGWFLHGILQRILVWIPVLRPLKEDPAHPPAWWFDCYSWYDWWVGIGADWYPNEYWCERYLRCALRHLGDRIVATANAFTQGVRSFLLDRIGWVHWAFDSMGAWVNSLSGKIGWVLPSWASSLIGGLWRLWDNFPQAIRNAWASWGDIWEDIKRTVREWVISRYEDARRWATHTWGWLIGVGQAIEQWWRTFANWLGELASRPYSVLSQVLGSAWRFLTEFWQNPTGWVINWLSPTWQNLAAFARDCLHFWYDVWGIYAEDLGDFLADPLEFLWEKGEHFLNRKLR